MSKLEIIASILGAISVGLVVLRNVWAFPIGIVMVSMYAWIFYEAKLYSDMLLQGFFFVLQFQGWYDWAKSEKGNDDKIMVRQLSQQQWLITVALLVVGTYVLGWAVKSIFPDASMPWLDAFAAVMSMLAQWWMNRRYLDNWTLWIIVDALYLYIYFSKALYPTFVLYGVFLAMAVAGYMEWKRKMEGGGKLLHNL
jgi:nicotinamide mononucleotide transporter